MIFECRCVGVIPHAKVQVVLDILRGISSSSGQEFRKEIVMKVPLQHQSSAPTSATEIRLVKLVNHDSASRQLHNGLREQAPERWLVRHEGLVLRGQASDLPASVREVTEAAAVGPGVFEFWQALGARVEYEYDRQGNVYACIQDGVEIQVFVFDLKRDGGILKAGYLIEAASVVDDKEHVTTSAKALGAFAQKLAPHVELKRADPRQ